MLKWGILSAVLFIMISSLYFFTNKKEIEADLSSAISTKTDHPGLSLDFFSVKSYAGTELNLSLSVNKVSFNESHQMEFIGDAKGWRKFKNREEKISADLILGDFAAEKFTDFLNNPKITKVYFKKNVKMSVGDFSLNSSSAKYDVEQRQISGDEWVHMENPLYEASGRQGFTFDLDKEILNIFGPVQGKVFSHE